MSFPKYPEYKDSKIEWLAEVPTHWDEGKVKHALIRVVAGGTPESGNSAYWSDTGNGTPWVTIADMTRDFLVKETEKEVSQLGLKSKGMEVLPSGSLIYSIYASLGKVAVLGVEAVTNQAILGLIPDIQKTDVGFLRWWMVSVENWLKAYSSSNTQDNLNAEKVKNLPALYPGLNEQRAIASFLDHETARIDALVEEQQRLIGLLKEKRQAVISHAVTKGLDPDVPMKDSGVEWLGEVPTHWDILRIGSIYVEAAEKGLAELPVLRVSIHHGVSDRELNEEESDRKITRIEDREKYKRVRHGDLVYNMMRAWQGGFGAVLVDGLVSPAYVVARPKSHDASEFIEQLLRTPSAIEEMRSRSYGITDFRLRLYWDQFKNIKIALPPREERQEIVNRLQEIIAESTALETEAGINISLLEERRSALVSAAVTGKIDVRGWQPPAGSSTPTASTQTEMV